MPSTVDRLVAYYGETDDPLLGGFILPWGTFLDFSEGSGGRSVDHRNIEWASRKRFEYRTETMIHVAKLAGIIRWMPEVWAIDTYTAPTRRQLETIEGLSELRSIIVEAIHGNRHFYREYDEWNSRRAAEDLADFYRR